MKNNVLAFGLLLCSTAFATAGDTSTVDQPRSTARHAPHSPGTTGAMSGITEGIATSSEDVMVQQSAGANSTSKDARRPTAQSPGTVGASPGSTSENRK